AIPALLAGDLARAASPDLWPATLSALQSALHTQAPSSPAWAYGFSTRFGDCDQALADRRAQEMLLEPGSDGKDRAVEQPDRPEAKPPALEQAERPPPTGISNQVEIVQPLHEKPGLLQLPPQLRAAVPAEVAEVLVDRRIYFGPGRHEQTQTSTAW